MIQYSMVIDPGLSGADLVAAVDRTLAAAEAEGGRPFSYAHTDTDRSGADTHVWFGVGDDEEVKAVEDPGMGAVYLLYQGKDADALEEPLAGALARKSCDELVGQLPGQLVERPERLMLLALCDSGRFHPGAAALIEQSLSSDSQERRLAAANTAALAKWPALTGAIERALADEVDERIKRTLDYALSVTQASS